MSLRWSTLAATAFAVAVLAAGCGGDGGDGSGGASEVAPGGASGAAGEGPPSEADRAEREGSSPGKDATAPDGLSAGPGSDGRQGSAAGPDGADANGSSSGSGGGAGPLSKSAYLEQANRICAKNQRETERAAAAFAIEHAGPGEADVLTVIRQVRVPMLEAKAAALRKLGAPRGDRREVEQIVASIETLADGIGKLDDIDGVTAKLNREANQTNRLVRRYGLDRCAEG